MWRVRLETAAGALVTCVLVPPYVAMPDVIVWGQRYFQRSGRGAYRECFCVVAWTSEEMQKMGYSTDRELTVTNFKG